jgi:hypothetical protein
MKPIVEYEFEGHKLPMELMVWDRDDQPELRLVYAIIPSHEFKYQVMDSEWTNEYKHAALPEGIEPKKKVLTAEDLKGKWVTDDRGNQFMVTTIHNNEVLFPDESDGSEFVSLDCLRRLNFKLEDGTPLVGES